MTLPDALSWSRVWAAVLFPVVFYLTQFFCFDCQYRFIVLLLRAILVVAAFLTDWLDGYIARVRNIQSEYGAWLDQFSDKILVTSLSIYFWLFEPVLWWPLVLLLLFREWGIVCLRARNTIPVQRLGKYKLLTQAMAFTMLAAGFSLAGILAYLAAIVLAYWSAYYYVRKAFIKTT